MAVVGVPALCFGPESPSVTIISDKVRSPRVVEHDAVWVITGLKRMVSWTMVDCTGTPIKTGTDDGKDILALQTDSFAHFKDTTTDCDCAVGENVIYRLALVPGQVVASGVTRSVWVFTDVGDLSPTILCC